jgi:hypothetical protein
VTGISADVSILKTYTNKAGLGYGTFQRGWKIKQKKRVSFLILFSKK